MFPNRFALIFKAYSFISLIYRHARSFNALVGLAFLLALFDFNTTMTISMLIDFFYSYFHVVKHMVIEGLEKLTGYNKPQVPNAPSFSTPIKTVTRTFQMLLLLMIIQ